MTRVALVMVMTVMAVMVGSLSGSPRRSCRGVVRVRVEVAMARGHGKATENVEVRGMVIVTVMTVMTVMVGILSSSPRKSCCDVVKVRVEAVMAMMAVIVVAKRQAAMVR